MSLTLVDLTNEALVLLGASPIQALTDTSAEARIVARALPRVLDRVLRSYPWNAVITRLDLTGQATGEDDMRLLANEILAYVARDMTSPEGGFYSAEDADSEGEEGLFYVWRPAEVIAVVGP